MQTTTVVTLWQEKKLQNLQIDKSPTLGLFFLWLLKFEVELKDSFVKNQKLIELLL